MKVGDYVRTKNIGGSIERIIDILPKEKTEDLRERYTTDVSKLYSVRIDERDIIKSSPNIIDLIEVGDYVNGFYVINKPFNQRIHTEFDDFTEEDIETIVTKEQFESMKYEVK